MDTVSGPNSYVRVQVGPMAENWLSASNPILLTHLCNLVSLSG